MSPTQRTQKFLRERSYIVANCERKLPATPFGYAGPLVTVDLFGIIDTMAVHANRWHTLLAVQSTSGANHAAHVDKIMAAKATRHLLMHMTIELWSWSKRGARGKRKVWTLRREEFQLSGKKIITSEKTTPL